ncbi:hypothetical protein [Prevotella melaninogenica]|nr:hypothetical protein [Prevotella melaninogenica]
MVKGRVYYGCQHGVNPMEQREQKPGLPGLFRFVTEKGYAQIAP